MQSRKQSFIESITNVLFGLIISIAATFIIFPLVGIKSTPTQNIMSNLGFTIVSILRQYLIRRYFNKKLKSMNHGGK